MEVSYECASVRPFLWSIRSFVRSSVVSLRKILEIAYQFALFFCMNIEIHKERRERQGRCVGSEVGRWEGSEVERWEFSEVGSEER